MTLPKLYYLFEKTGPLMLNFIFKASGVRPLAMYVSTHEAGALYLAPVHPKGQMWDFKGYEVRKGIKIGTPRFPKVAFNLGTGRPALFAARGSHGLWTQPGEFLN